MKDKIKAAIVAELQRQATYSETNDIEVDASYVLHNNELTVDGVMDLDALAEAIERVVE